MVPYHMMNIVTVWQPRWHDRVILPRVDKFKLGSNLITVKHHNYPSKYYMHSKTADNYPQETKQGRFGPYQVYVIPLDDLTTVEERQSVLEGAKEVFA